MTTAAGTSLRALFFESDPTENNFTRRYEKDTKGPQGWQGAAGVSGRAGRAHQGLLMGWSLKITQLLTRPQHSTEWISSIKLSLRSKLKQLS